MITSGILLMVWKILTFVIAIFPYGTGFPVEVHSAFTTLGSYLGLIDVLVPVSTIVWCLTFIFGIEIIIFGVKTLLWIFGWIPLFKNRSNQSL